MVSTFSSDCYFLSGRGSKAISHLTVRIVRTNSRFEKNWEVMKSSFRYGRMIGLKDSIMLGDIQSPLEVCGLGYKAGAISRAQCFPPAIVSHTVAGSVLVERWI